MRCGSIVFAVSMGLGHLAKSFFDAGLITDVLIQRHRSRQEHPEWFPGAQRYTHDGAYEFCKKQDVMLFLETPFSWELIPYCREHGVKTVIMPMYECMPKVISHQPDLWLCPSVLDFQYTAAFDPTHKTPCTILPVPVSVPWRQRTKAEVFVHNAGNGGLKGRNGTQELLDAWQYIKSPVEMKVRHQGELASGASMKRNAAGGMLTVQPGTIPYENLFEHGDVFIFPEKFNALSLPLQEAYASGMLVMATDRFPMNTWLPTAPLIPVQSYQKTCVHPRFVDFQQAVIDPKAIAAKVDEWYGRDVSGYSLEGKEWADTMSWEVLKPKYAALLEDLVNG